jgi:hypothetical protein
MLTPLLRRTALASALVLMTVTALAFFFVNPHMSTARAWHNQCTVQSSIQSNFNGTTIAANDFIWFTSVVKVNGLNSSQLRVFFKQQTIQFAANGKNYTLQVPNGLIDINPNTTSATTSFDTSNGTWQTIAPSNTSGNTFLSGFAFRVPAGGLPGGINPVTWSGKFNLPLSPQVTVNWQWAAAVYTSFSTNYSQLGVKAADDNHFPPYQNSDHAGTPENFKSFVTGGARGGGGSNWTGSLSGTASVACP